MRDHQRKVFRHRAPDALEEVEVEIRRGMVLAIGLPVTAREERPVLPADLAAFEPAKADARLAHLAPFLVYFLSLVMTHVAEKVFEARVLPVDPVKLHAVP
ncbi:hypothetical protein D3C83_19850 [compost metagenome]